MSVGDMWLMPGGHEGMEVSGSTRTVLRLAVRVPAWPFPRPPVEVARNLCERMPSRYLHGAIPAECEEALL